MAIAREDLSNSEVSDFLVKCFMLYVSLQERAADAEAEKEILQHEISAEKDNNQNLQVHNAVK